MDGLKFRPGGRPNRVVGRIFNPSPAAPEHPPPQRSPHDRRPVRELRLQATPNRCQMHSSHKTVTPVMRRIDFAATNRCLLRRTYKKKEVNTLSTGTSGIFFDFFRASLPHAHSRVLPGASSAGSCANIEPSRTAWPSAGLVPVLEAARLLRAWRSGVRLCRRAT
jgi:hypothetical protein